MTRLVRFSNNAVSRLAANITNADTSISLTPGDGAKFPVISGTQFFMATLIKSDGTTEIVKVTARSSDTLTVVRAAEPVGATQVAYAFTAGDRIEHRMTAKALSDELDRLDSGANIGTANKTANYTVLANDVSTLIRVDTTAGAITVTLPQISSLTDDFDIMVAKVASDANTVNVVRAGSTDLINGVSSYVINNQWQSVWLIADRSTGTWTAINSGAGSTNVTVDSFTGSGTDGPFALSGDPGSKNNTAVYVGGVYQQKSTYTLSGQSLTLGGTVASGVSIEVCYSTPLNIGAPADGSVTTAKLADAAVTTAKMANAAVTTAKLASDVTTSISMATPPGSVIFFAGSAAPSGFLKANGALVSRTTYAALFAAIGTTYGVGDGSTTFKLPDLRGEFLRGLDDGRGVDSGRGLGTAQSDAFRSHTHVMPYNGVDNTNGYSAWRLTGNVEGSGANTGGENTGGGTETRPRNVALLACIKY